MRKGFTLIELLVVMSIIFLLSTIVLTNVYDAAATANDAKRISDLRNVQQALEQYAGDHDGAVPATGASAATAVWHSQCPGWGGQTPANVIPGLSPKYISQIPSDPDMDPTGDNGNGVCCYLYISDGIDYDFMDYNCPLLGITNATVANMIDPRYRGAWAVYSSGRIAKGW